MAKFIIVSNPSGVDPKKDWADQTADELHSTNNN